MAAQSTKRLIVVSNRLPYVLEKQRRRQVDPEAGVRRSGDGASAGAPRPGRRLDRLAGGHGRGARRRARSSRKAARGSRVRARAGALSARDEVDKYYHGYSNESIWPLFHDLQSRCEFDPDILAAYVKVNAQVRRRPWPPDCRADDFVWIHDYQLMDVAHHAREADCAADLAFFLHIPFPSPDIFMKLPERQAVLNSLLAYDLVGFQTAARPPQLHPVRADAHQERARAASRATCTW